MAAFKKVSRRYEKASIKSRLFLIGRRERIRTSDPLVPNQLRYQAALLAVCITALTLFIGAKGGT